MRISKNESIVWGGLLVLFGFLAAAENFYKINAWVWVGTLAVGGFGSYFVYSKDRSEKSLLIISYVMLAVSLMLGLIVTNLLQGEFVAVYILICVATPFLYYYFRSGNSNWGLLIPAYTLFAVALMLLLVGFNLLNGLLIAAFVNFAVALPFFYVYFKNKKHWWALIPGGVTAVVALSFMISSSAKFVGPATLIVAGIWLLSRQFTNKGSD